MDDEKPRIESIIKYYDHNPHDQLIRETVKDYYDHNPYVEPNMKALISVLESWQEDQKELEDPPEVIPVPTGFDIEWE